MDKTETFDVRREDGSDIARTPAQIRHLPIRAGEDVTLVFGHDGLKAYYNGISAGHISDTQLTQLMLAVFIGQNVMAPRLKRELLGT